MIHISHLIIPSSFVLLLTIIAIVWTTNNKNYMTSIFSGILGFCALMSIFIFFVENHKLKEEIEQYLSKTDIYLTKTNGVTYIINHKSQKE